jgi:hypothetical protein
MLRRFTAAGFAAVLIAGGLAFFVGTAHAAPPHPKCPNPAGKYPPGQCKFKTTKTSAHPGDPVQVQGTGFSKNCGVTIKLDLTTIGATKTDGNGTFSGTAKIPTNTKPGSHTLSANDNCSSFVLGEHFTVLPALTKGSGLPFTGFVFWPVLGGGAVLVIMGAAFIAVGRRRRIAGLHA